MFKNKFKIISIFLVIILFLAPIVRADDTNSQNVTNEQVTANVEAQATQASNSQENYKDGDLYLTGDEVTIDYIVDGNLFVLANTVNIKITANNLTPNFMTSPILIIYHCNIKVFYLSKEISSFTFPFQFIGNYSDCEKNKV